MIVMKIEDAIEQRKFRNDIEKLLVNFIYTNNWLKEFQVRLLKPFDLTMQQYNILRILRGSHPEPLTQKVIKAKMLDKMSDVSRLLARLEKKKLVSCVSNKDDRRNLDVTILKNGMDILLEIDAVLPLLDGLFVDFAPNELETMNGLFDRIREGKFPDFG